MSKSPRLDATFAKCRAENRTALSIFISAGDPDLATSTEIFTGLPGAGADLIELGMPFTDPVGDGPSVQLAGQRALNAGIKLEQIFDMLRTFREQDDSTPVILMGYYNTMYAYGVSRFLDTAAEAGADGVIMVDLPPEEDDEMWDEAVDKGVVPIRLIAPQTTEARFPVALRNTHGFIYLVALEGVTGAAMSNEEAVAQRIAELRGHTDVPIAVGFGIKTPEDVQRMAPYADAVIVGSAVVDTIRHSLDGQSAATQNTVSHVLDLIRDLKTGVSRDT